MVIRKAPSFHVNDIRNNRLQSAAEMIDERVGKKNDDKITAKDLKKAEKALAKDNAGAFQELSATELDILKGAMPLLSDYLKDDGEAARGPFCTSLSTSAVLAPTVRACAEEVARAFGKGEAEINLTELRQAKAALESGALPDGVDTAKLTEAGIAELELFMATGKGSLVTHRDVRIDGKPFDEAFPLPGDPDDAEVIAALDARLDGCGYDRVYIKDQDNKLYVVLNESGDLKIRPHMQVQMGREGAYMDSGTVVAVKDVNNSLGEATLSFWGDWISRTVSFIRGKLGKDLDSGLQQAADQAASAAHNPDKPDAKAPESMQLKDWMMWGGVMAGVGVTAMGVTTVLPVLASVGGAMTAFNLVDYAKAKMTHDKRPVYHAMGINIHRDDRIR